jgi:nicotinate-nucleotide pyrophosphorylase (carboxylating)
MNDLENQIEEVIDRALAEDLSGGDITTDVLISGDKKGRASFLVKDNGILAGIDIAGQVLRKTDEGIDFEVFILDGSKIKRGDIVAVVNGRLAGILKAERTALNFLQRLSGIATETSHYVAAIEGLPVTILDTRKTTPGLRYLEKYAVRMGGGRNHRKNLSDAVLIKDNHLEALHNDGIGLKEAVLKIRQEAPEGMQIEVETKTLEEVSQAIEAGAGIIMLDNMDLETMRRAVRIIRGRAKIEASGNITLNNVRLVAETGVDFISIGALTHSVKALDISLEFEKGEGDAGTH